MTERKVRLPTTHTLTTVCLQRMETGEFQRALTLGLGRAVLQLHDHDGRLYRDVILDACLHNRAYDPQVEGSRAEYMIDVMRESGEMAFLADAVLRSLSDAEHNWDTPQRFAVARRLAQSGNSEAREAMYAAFETREFSARDVAEEFVVLDGVPGLLFVVSRIGIQLARNSEEWEDDYLLSEARRVCGPETVDAALQDAAKTNANVRVYLDRVNKNIALKAATSRVEPEGLTYSQIRTSIEAGQAGGLLTKWGQLASDSDLDAAAHDLIQERDPQKLQSYLRIFRKRSFLLEISLLLKLVELTDGPVPRHALSVLANLHDERIRSLAFRLIETRSSKRAYSIDLLVQNFRDGDHQIVESWCDAETDPGAINAFDRSLRDLFAAHPDLDSETRLLRNFYEMEPCAHCRCDIVERLSHLNTLTEDIRRECEYDSYAETRSLVKVGRTI
jgi:hypothetical protein